MDVALRMSAINSSTRRDQALDFTKGALVVLMVLYHWINYFISTKGMVYRYIRFISPSFIFITGFLISHAYLAKYDLRDARLPKRLLVRGLKLLTIFTALNLAAGLAVSRNYNGSAMGVDTFLRNAFSIYITGNGREAVFEILVPISLALLLSAALLWVRRWLAFPVYAVCVALSAVILIADSCGLKSVNLEFVGVGLLGVYFGSIGAHRLTAWLARIRWVMFGYLGYLVAITIWDVYYSLQIVGVCLTLFLIYWLGSKWTGPGLLLTRILLLGRYSLLAYIAQIVVLQLLLRIMRPVESPGLRLALSILGALVLTQFTVEVAEWSRKKSKPIDALYRSVFA